VSGHQANAAWFVDACCVVVSRFSLSQRNVETLLAERVVAVSQETVRRWNRESGQSFANCVGRRRPRLGDNLHLDEVFIRIQGVQHYLWRAFDQDGVVLSTTVRRTHTDRRDGTSGSCSVSDCRIKRSASPQFTDPSTATSIHADTRCQRPSRHRPRILGGRRNRWRDHQCVAANSGAIGGHRCHFAAGREEALHRGVLQHATTAMLHRPCTGLHRALRICVAAEVVQITAGDVVAHQRNQFACRRGDMRGPFRA
jgi:hypothetical protein